MDVNNVVVQVIRDVANLQDDKQIEVFWAIASFPAIMLPVLKMMSTEILSVVESSRTISFQGPCTFKLART